MALFRANGLIGGDRGADERRRLPDSVREVPGESSGKAGAGCPARPRWRRNLCLGLAIATCPCHLPIIAALLSGTAAGALLGEHFTLAFLLFLATFVVSIRAAVRLSR